MSYTYSLSRKHPRSFDQHGGWVELDARHQIAREFTGAPGRQWVFRFCDDWIGAYPTRTEAQKAALQWEHDRADRMRR